MNPTGEIMGLRPTQGDEKRLGLAATLYRTVASPLSSRPERSGGICSSDLSWKCFSTGVATGLRPTQG